MTTLTLDPATKGATLTLSNGNLTAAYSSTGPNASVLGTSLAYKSSQKWYAEVTINALDAGAGYLVIGVTSASQASTNYIGEVVGYGYGSGGSQQVNGSQAGYGSTFGAGDIISILYDADAGTIRFWKNGVDKGQMASGLSGSKVLGVSGKFFIGTATGQCTVNFGNSAFTYTPTAGFLPWQPDGSAGNAAVTMQPLTAQGQRIAAGAVTMQPLTAVGGFNGHGAAILPAFTAHGVGGTKGGVAVLQSFSAAGTGHSATTGQATMLPLTMAATGSTGALVEGAFDVPKVTLDSSGVTGDTMALALTVPMPTVEIHFQAEADLTIPVPSLSAVGVCGEIGEAALSIKTPTLDAVGLCGSVLTAAITVPAPKVVATGLSELIGSVALSLRAAYLTATGTSGEVGIAALTIPKPTLVFEGFGPFTADAALTFSTQFYLDATGIAALAASIRTWVLNLRKKGLTEYTGFTFNSYADMGEEVLAANDSGLFRLTKTAADDAGAAINATVRTGKETFGTTFNKRVPRIYAGYASAGSLNFVTITSKDGRRVYLLPDNGMANVQQRRVPVGRGPKSPYWQFEVSNIAGCDFQLENLQVYPEKTHRRVI